MNLLKNMVNLVEMVQVNQAEILQVHRDMSNPLTADQMDINVSAIN